MTILEQMGANAKVASRILAVAGKKKDDALLAIANALRNEREAIKAANAVDIENGRKAGLSESLIDRLMLTDARIDGMALGCEQVAALPDPIGEILSGKVLANGLELRKVRVPMGVIGIIFEARPNVTADAAALCLKAGSAVILRGGKEAINSNKSIAAIMRGAVKSTGLPEDAIQLVEDTNRQSSIEMMGLSDYLDVLIPRGGAGLIRAVVENSKVPVIETGVGNCHVYVDESANIEMAADIIFNAKTSRPSVCNAIETVLVHSAVAEKALPIIKARLDEKGVEIHGCEKTREILGDSVILATEDDWYTEYLDLKLAIRVVDSLNEAMDHIAKYSSGHSECIVTENYENSRIFTAGVDSAAVYVNASTRFTDGGEFGLGAEIGISTQKLHARGPMGLNELTSMKFIINGNGQVR
ncbi:MULTISPECIES: glutamate-5-semialdehyde dehydrogenase [unclassified Ruminococcus]|uniref:glutamate-5-semialdehyde dehydrogenase n=1 Tax=unclassified Ruminococcus TaxID=2608920 RepID=UPI00210DAF2E|nr:MULTISPECIES: glutamate-5-semialdehyde dehydrogenase [unclassified Ruminococcus]MCQ4022024.1 glutamate-5-semialdehyde dehydrogenase [Ruminococcus sp. zg-924]MCQ4114560.1 glutamate-5-semialdehyde dehydrogenase [Ruminococcus sp. zg-921]